MYEEKINELKSFESQWIEATSGYCKTRIALGLFKSDFELFEIETAKILCRCFQLDEYEKLTADAIKAFDEFAELLNKKLAEPEASSSKIISLVKDYGIVGCAGLIDEVVDCKINQPQEFVNFLNEIGIPADINDIKLYRGLLLGYEKFLFSIVEKKFYYCWNMDALSEIHDGAVRLIPVGSSKNAYYKTKCTFVQKKISFSGFYVETCIGLTSINDIAYDNWDYMKRFLIDYLPDNLASSESIHECVKMDALPWREQTEPKADISDNLQNLRKMIIKKNPETEEYSFIFVPYYLSSSSYFIDKLKEISKERVFCFI